MTYVIASACIDVKDGACQDVCPVECIYEGGRMMYIQPDECIDCGLCLSVCPVDAIYAEDDLPESERAFRRRQCRILRPRRSPAGARRAARTRGTSARSTIRSSPARAKHAAIGMISEPRHALRRRRNSGFLRWRLLDETARGVYVIAATPFSDDGALDLASADRMVDFYLERGADGLTLLGIMGEAPKLSAEESRSFLRRALTRMAGRVPAIVGVSAPGFAPMKELAASAMEAGRGGRHGRAAPAICAPTTRFSIIIEGVAETLGAIPFVLQDYPLTTNVQIPPAVDPAHRRGAADLRHAQT